MPKVWETCTIEPSTELPDDCDARSRSLQDYWRSIRPTGGLPGYVEPLDLTRLWRWLWLVDVQPAPLRFRYRLIGTSHREVLGADPTGRWIDDVFPGFVEMRAHADMVAVAGGAISYCRQSPEFPIARKLLRIERLLLPLARDGAGVDMLLCLSLFTGEDRKVI